MHTNKKMKNKRVLIITLVIVLILNIIGVCIFILKNKTIDDGTQEEQRKPDIVIKGTKKDPIKLEGFEVTNIDIYNTSDISLDVKATIVNNTDKTVKGFFIQIGLFDENGKQITVVAENHEEEIVAGGKYVLESSVVGKKIISTIKSAKLISLEKDTKSTLEDEFKEVTPN